MISELPAPWPVGFFIRSGLLVAMRHLVDGRDVAELEVPEHVVDVAIDVVEAAVHRRVMPLQRLGRGGRVRRLRGGDGGG
jgi:hypothetical protein